MLRFGLVWRIWLELKWFGKVRLGYVELEIDRLGFSLVWLGLTWLISLFEKNDGESTCGQRKIVETPSGEKNRRRNDLAMNSPSGKTGR